MMNEMRRNELNELEAELAPELVHVEAQLQQTMARPEARHPEHGSGDWDSDYLGVESYPVDQARALVEGLIADPEWSGWQFRLALDDGGYEYL